MFVVDDDVTNKLTRQIAGRITKKATRTNRTNNNIAGVSVGVATDDDADGGGGEDDDDVGVGVDYDDNISIWWLCT